MNTALQKTHNVVASTAVKSIKKTYTPKEKYVRVNYLGQFECVLCGCICRDQKALDTHLNGNKHLRQLEAVQQTEK